MLFQPSKVNSMMHFFTAMDNVVLPRIEMAVRSITASSRRGPNKVVQNPDQRGFSGNLEDIPLMTASSCTDLNIKNNRNDETRSSENIKDGDFPARKSN